MIKDIIEYVLAEIVEKKALYEKPSKNSNGTIQHVMTELFVAVSSGYTHLRPE